MNTFLRTLAVILIACALTACPETKVAPDFGYQPAVLIPADWNGTWQVVGENEPMRLEVSDAPNGQITLTDPPKSADKKPQTSTLTLRHATPKKDGDLYFATLRDLGDDSPNASPVLLHTHDKDAFIVWTIDNDAVAAAIKKGQLQGKVTEAKDGAHSLLDSTTTNYELLAQPQFWDWKEPMTLKRLKD
jgi:hypothetical protein